MVERICQTCRYGNPVEAQFCNKCGTALERQLPALPGRANLVIAGRSLPVSWRQVGKTVAIGAAALAAEVGIAWLRRRMDGTPASTALVRATQATRTPDKAVTNSSAASIVTIISQRVIEVLDNGDGRRQITEQHIWRKIEE